MSSGNYKYPFIPKEYYPAVMFACKMIRDGRGRNDAVAISARYYDLDEDEISKHLAARSAAGQKGKTKSSPKYYLVSRTTESDNPSFEGISDPEVVTKTKREELLSKGRDTGYSYISYYTVAGPYDSREKAQAMLNGWLKKKKQLLEEGPLGFAEHQMEQNKYFNGK